MASGCSHDDQRRGDSPSYMSPPAGADQPRPSPSPARGGLGSADEHRDLAQRGAPSHGPIRPSDGEDEPRESQNLGEIAAGQPTSTEEEDASRLERALSNESWRRHRRGPHPRRDRTQPHEGLAENAAGRPISSSEAEPEPDSMQGPHGRETCQDGNDDIEKGSWRAPAPAVCQSPRRTLEPPKTEPMIPESTRAPPRWLTELYTISYLIFFSIMGTLARLGMQWLTFYPGAPIVTPVVWANFAGSVVMGFLAEDQALFRDHFPPPADAETPLSAPTDAAVDLEKERKAASAKTKKTIPLYIGLATGFCGSFTSFSSFARDAFLALSNDLPTPLDHPAALPSTTATLPRHGGYSFEAWAAVVLITLALSLGGLLAGAHLALFLHPYTPRLPHRLLDPLTLLLATGTWLGALALCIRPPDRSAPPETWRGDALFALVLAPPACLLRFYTSQHLNPLLPTFPLGTFTVNMSGVALEALCYDLQHVTLGGRVACQLLQGLMDGFCGCLTTVSTWAAELHHLRPRHAWRYALASLAGALALTLVIMGGVRWSVGYRAPACETGYPDKIHG